jgi:hypothetical protein
MHSLDQFHPYVFNMKPHSRFSLFAPGKSYLFRMAGSKGCGRFALYWHNNTRLFGSCCRMEVDP